VCLCEFVNESNLLEIKTESTFDSKRIDYKSKFNISINLDLVSNDLKNSISGMTDVNFDVFGGKQKRLSKGTIVLSEVIRKLPDETIEDMKMAIDRHDSIIFITEVMEYDSSKYLINWNKKLSPDVKVSIEEDLNSLGSKGKWKRDKLYEIGSNVPKNFLFKYEPLNESFKQLIFRKNNQIVEKRIKETSNIVAIEKPITIKNWNSGRISGNSWRFEKVNATLNPNGLLNISGKQSSNRWQGFTGAMTILLKDKNGKLIRSVRTKDSGVSGLSDRTFNQTIKIEPSIVKKVSKIELKATRR